MSSDFIRKALRYSKRRFFSSKSTPTPNIYHLLVFILRTHHNSHAMPSRPRNYYPHLIQPQLHHSRLTTRYVISSFSYNTAKRKVPADATLFFTGSPGDKYQSLNEHFMESRESLFASVESATAEFNKWTVESPPLLVIRLVAGICGFLVLIGIWNGWRGWW